MQWLIDFLERHMTKAVFVTTLSSILQMLGYMGNDGHIADEALKQIMASSSGLQAVMLMILYLVLKNQKKKD